MVCFGLGAAAYNSGSSSNILFLALSLLFSSLLLSGVLSALNFRNIRWRISPPGHLRAGERAEIAVEVLNAKRYLPSFSLQLSVEAQQQGARETLMLDRSLQPGRVRELQWDLRPERRGKEQLRVAALASSYPFGFLKKYLHSDASRSLVVWPRRVAYHFPAPGTRPARRFGATLRRPGTGEQLYNIRRYQAGDQQRMVHWKASARTRRLMVRQLMDERQDGFLIVVEARRALWQIEEQFEKMISLAASLAEDLFRQQRLLGYVINGGGRHTVSRLSDLHGFLDALAVEVPVDQVPDTERLGEAPVITFSPQTTEGVHVMVNGREVGGTD